MYYRQRPIKIGPYTTSRIEIIDLLKSWIVLSIAFSILREGFSLSVTFLQTLVFSAITVGTAFLLHEIGHKIAAQRYGCFAEFRSNDRMLMMALI
ncbi:MAG: metalloprotease, partial [Candidatus Heimdallarchaeota archaeon]|nr:metalloprotease [Candidatus Heimdallarchaeota archaeon]